MVEVGLELHCRDDNRRGSHEHESFAFLGYTFRTRSTRNKHGRMFASFLPAVSRDAVVVMGRQVRRWRIHLRTGGGLTDLVRWMNPIVRGWMQLVQLAGSEPHAKPARGGSPPPRDPR